MKQYFYTLLHPFYTAGMEPLRFIRTHSVSSVQPYCIAGDLPAKKENEQK